MNRCRYAALTATCVGLGCLAVLNAKTAFATEVMGRVVTGAFLSQERLKDPPDGLPVNDFSTASGRIFLDVADISKSNIEVVADLRDQNDFFDKLDSEKLALTQRNRPQVQQLAIKMPNDRIGFYGSVGRFPVPAAGAVLADGAEAGVRFTPGMSAAAFGGLNPKRDEQAYTKFNSDSQVGGAYFLIQPRFHYWKQAVYVSNAVVTKRAEGRTERTFFYNNMILQPNRQNRLMTLAYLDFVPSIRLQQGFLAYGRELVPSLESYLAGSTIDAVEYSRRKGLLERLPSSPYTEGTARLTWRLAPTSALVPEAIFGKRREDQLSKQEYVLMFHQSKLGIPEFGVRFGGGYVKNFTSDDMIARGGVGYYSDKWEFTLDENLAKAKYRTGEELNSYFTQLAASRYFGRAVYATLSFEHARDEKVNIFSGFFKLAYNFGNRELPAVRKDAPVPVGAGI